MYSHISVKRRFWNNSHGTIVLLPMINYRLCELTLGKLFKITVDLPHSCVCWVKLGCVFKINIYFLKLTSSSSASLRFFDRFIFQSWVSSSVVIPASNPFKDWKLGLLMVDKRLGVNPDDDIDFLVNSIRDLVEKRGVKVIMLDYLQLIDGIWNAKKLYLLVLHIPAFHLIFLSYPHLNFRSKKEFILLK